MRLTGLHINGFGLFHDLKIDGLSPALSVLLGMNEAGKSTLLGFVRAILFGFPDRRSHDNLYPPLAGGKHGGNVTLVSDDQKGYVLERYPGPRGGKVDILKPDHTRGGKALLARLLGMANKTLFKNIYAFSLSELQSFETLDTESVRETLYSAGAGIDPSALARLKSSLEKRENELYRPGGIKPRINALLSDLNHNLKEKRQLTNYIDEYDRIMARITHLSDDIQHLDEKKLQRSIQLKKTEKWITIWPAWINLTLAMEKLEAVEAIEHFPSQGLSRFETLKTRLEGLETERLEKEEDLRRQESELSSLKGDWALLDLGASISQLQKDQGHFEAVVEELRSIQQQIAVEEAKLKESLHRLGPHWGEESILEFDLSIAVREEVRQLREAFRVSQLEEQMKRESVGHLVSRKREVEEVIRNLPEPTIKDPGHLARMKRFCQELRGLQSQERLLQEALRNINERRNDLTEERAVLAENQGLQTYHLPILVVFILIGAGILLLMGYALGGLRSWSMAFGGLFLCSGLLLWLLKPRLAGRARERAQRVERRLDFLKAKTDDLAAKQSDLSKELDRTKERMGAISAMLTQSQFQPTEGPEQMEEAISGHMRHLERWINASQDLARLQNKHEEGLKELRLVQSELGKVQERWETWLEDRRLDPALTPDGALETLSLMASFREQEDHLGQLRSRAASLEGTKQNFLDLANQALRSCNRRPVGSEEVQVAVQRLVEEFLRTEKAAQKKTLLLDEIRASRQSIQRVKDQIARLKGEMSDLMASAGAENEEQFRERASLYEKRMNLEADRERYEDNIKRLSSDLGPVASVMKKLSKLSLEELEERKIRWESELKEVETARDQLKKEQATLEERARQLVTDDRISMLRTEEEALKQELSFLADEWATIRLAYRLVRMAGARYQEERQPEVIREAGRFFNQLTLGRYPSLVAPIGENKIEVLCQDSSVKEISQLSRGTAEQLYLSLRFGFIREFSKASESLPIIMDEILVNFDPQRVRATAEAIVGLSQEHQVLFFTCHPRMAALFREIDPHIPVLEISEGEVKRWDDAQQKI